MRLWGEKDEGRRRRTLCFALGYFFLYLISSFFFIMSRYIGTAEARWYLQHPWEALRTGIFELGQNPIFLIPFFLMALYVLILGFGTDLVYSFLRKSLKLRKDKLREKAKEEAEL